MCGARVLYVVALLILAIALAATCWHRRAAIGKIGGAPGAAPHGAAAVQISWDPLLKCLPRAALVECLAAARGLPGYAPVTEEERATLAVAAEKISAKYDISLRADTLVAMRTMEAAHAAQTSGVLAQRHGRKILDWHRQGVPVVAIAGRKNLPPVAVLRQLLIELGCSAADVRERLRSPGLLPPELRSQLGEIYAADLGSRANAERIQAAATAYERALGARLLALGVAFTTEDESRKKSSRAPGLPPAATLTPDFLLASPVEINGRPVHWIDAKNYPMYGSKLVAKKLAKQAQKYTDEFGPGAFVFSGGVLCGARVPPALPLLLDGSGVTAA